MSTPRTLSFAKLAVDCEQRAFEDAERLLAARTAAGARALEQAAERVVQRRRVVAVVEDLCAEPVAVITFFTLMS